jgi:hypothetical protein
MKVGGALKYYAFQSETMLNNFLIQPKLNAQPINESLKLGQSQKD